MNLEEFIADSNAKIAAGGDPPEGGDFGAQGIVTITPGRREAYRNYALLVEVAGGVYVLPDASGLSRFP